MTEDGDGREGGVIFLSPIFLSKSFGSGRRPGWEICGSASYSSVAAVVRLANF